MTDFPYVGPPVDGLQQALVAARHRRLRSAGVSSGTSALALMVVAMLVSQSGRQTLVQGPTPETPAVTTVDLVPDSAGRAPRPNTAVGADPQALDGPGSVAPPSRSAGSTASDRQASRDGSPGPSSRRSSGGQGPVSGPMKAGYGSTPLVDGCPLSNSARGKRLLCPTADYTTLYDDKNTQVGFTLTATLCSYDAEMTTVHFASTREADVAILDDKGKTVWRWSVEHTASPDAHTLLLGTGECWTWSTDWALLDQQGRRLPAGSYTLVSDVHAAELGADRSGTAGITVA